MKLLLTDANGAEFDLNAVVLGLAADIYRLNERLTRVESELGINYQDAEAEAIANAEENNGSDTTE